MSTESLNTLPPLRLLQRAYGSIKLEYCSKGTQTRLQKLYQSGSSKVLFPRVHAGYPEAVLLNTSGGMTGDDEFKHSISVGDNAGLTVTTQAAERVYRSPRGAANVTTSLRLAPGAHLAWLPQETIFFNGACLNRRLNIELAADASLLAVESLVLGRAAMGEILEDGLISDHWRIRRAGKLVFADSLRLASPIDSLVGCRATWDGMQATALIVYVAADASARLEDARSLLSHVGIAQGASAWDGLLSIRLLAPSAAILREALGEFLTGFRRQALPQVWEMNRINNEATNAQYTSYQSATK